MLKTKSYIYLASASMIIAGLSGPASAQSLLDQVYALIAPGVVGNVAQVGVGATRIGSTGGLSGSSGTPTTVVGVNVDSTGSQVCGSPVTVNVLQGGKLLSSGC